MQNRKSGAPKDNNEPKITAEMIEAARRYLYDCALDSFSTWFLEDDFIEGFARSILIASLKRESEGFREIPSQARSRRRLGP
jgi:hypothetical protein